MDKIDTIKLTVSFLVGLWAAVKGIPGAIRLGKRVLDGMTIVEQIGAEFKPNGGSTIKDALVRLEALMTIERERNRAVSTMLPAGMFETDEAGLNTWVSSKYTELTGLTLADAIGWGWAASVHDDDRVRVIAEWTSAFSQERRSIICYRAHVGDSVRHLMVETFPVLSGDKCIGHIGLVSLNN